MSFFQFVSGDRCFFSRHNEQSAEIDVRLPLLSNRSSGVFTGLAVTSGPGLSLNIAIGNALINGVLRNKTTTSALSAVNTNFNFVYISGAGTITRVTGLSNFPSTYAILAVAQASGGTFKGLRDLRTRIGDYWLKSPGNVTAWRITIDSDGILGTST